MKTSNSFKSPGHRLIQFLAFLLIGSSPSLRAQVADLPFSSGSTGADGELYLVAPRARTNHSMVYDAARQNVVLFGGSSSAGISNDTYTWNGTRWTQERPASLPAARSQQSMAYDAVRQEVVMFGGYSGSITNDTWVWNGVTWASKTSLTVPTPR